MERNGLQSLGLFKELEAERGIERPIGDRELPLGHGSRHLLAGRGVVCYAVLVELEAHLVAEPGLAG